MSSSNEIELLKADVRYYRERIALARARMYGHGRGSNARLQELERGLERAEQRLSGRRSREQRAGEQDANDGRATEQPASEQRLHEAS